MKPALTTLLIAACSIFLINTCNENPVSSDVSSIGKIVFVMLDKTVHRSLLYKMDLNGENVRQLTFADELLDTADFQAERHSPRGSASEPRWSPDGKKIVYSESQGPDESHIVIMNEDGSGKKSLTNVGSYAIRPRWSPSGDKILYLKGFWGVITDISIVDTNGIYYGGNSFDIQISPDSKIFEGDSVWYGGDPQWYHDSQHLYILGNIGTFPSIPLCGENTKEEIFLLEIATGKVTARLTYNNIDECGFEIAPDGNNIVVFRGPYQIDTKIYLMSIAGSSLSAITSGKNDYLPRWSNDGKYIVYTKDLNDDPYREERRIFIVDPKQPLEEIEVSSLVGEEPDIFINHNLLWR